MVASSAALSTGGGVGIGVGGRSGPDRFSTLFCIAGALDSDEVSTKDRIAVPITDSAIRMLRRRARSCTIQA
jgi:hypothetical protein